MMKKTIFLDRDGVINVNRADYVKSWQEFIFLPGVLEALKLLTEQQIQVIIITNQSAIGRGIITEETLNHIHQNMVQEIEKAGGKITAIYHCPHTPWDNCTCRKPAPGMLIQAAEIYQLNLSEAFFVGDAISDIETGINAGCQTVFVQTGKHQYQLDKFNIQPDYIFETLMEFVQFIINQLSKGKTINDGPY